MDSTTCHALSLSLTSVLEVSAAGALGRDASRLETQICLSIPIHVYIIQYLQGRYRTCTLARSSCQRGCSLSYLSLPSSPSVYRPSHGPVFAGLDTIKPLHGGDIRSKKGRWLIFSAWPHSARYFSDRTRSPWSSAFLRFKKAY